MAEVRRIYLTRHCEPQLPYGIPVCIGKTDIPLSESGRKQAIHLGYYFSSVDLSGIYSSPLIRAKETADIISNQKFKVVIKNDFSEFNIGKWDGMSFADIKVKYPQEYKDRGENLEHYIVEGGESMAMCRDRAFSELWNTINESEGNIIIIAHAGVNRTILSAILGINVKESFLYRHEYGSINLLLYDGENLIVDKIGVTCCELLKE